MSPYHYLGPEPRGSASTGGARAGPQELPRADPVPTAHRADAALPGPGTPGPGAALGAPLLPVPALDPGRTRVREVVAWNCLVVMERTSDVGPVSWTGYQRFGIMARNDAGEGRGELGPLLSVVIPAYRESQRIGWTLEALADALDGTGAEIIVVDDGSDDDTAEVAEKALASVPRGTVLRRLGNAGKGAAVRTGVMAAHRGHDRLHGRRPRVRSPVPRPARRRARTRRASRSVHARSPDPGRWAGVGGGRSWPGASTRWRAL